MGDVWSLRRLLFLFASLELKDAAGEREEEIILN